MRSKEHAAGGTICARLIPAKTICSLEFPVVGKGRDSDSGRVEGGSGGGHRRVYYSRDLLVGGGRLLMPVNYYLSFALYKHGGRSLQRYPCEAGNYIPHLRDRPGCEPATTEMGGTDWQVAAHPKVKKKNKQLGREMMFILFYFPSNQMPSVSMFIL